jgi:hypothetical protein
MMDSKIIHLRLMELLRHILEHDNVLPRDIAWLRDFRQRYPAATTTWYITGAALIEYNEVFIPMNLRVMIHVPNHVLRIDELIDESDKTAGPPTMPSCLQRGTIESRYMIAKVGEAGESRVYTRVGDGTDAEQRGRVSVRSFGRTTSSLLRMSPHLVIRGAVRTLLEYKPRCSAA